MRVLVLALLLGAAPAPADDAGVETIHGDGHVRVEARVPGVIVDHAVVHDASGRAIVLLVAPPADPEPRDDVRVVRLDDADGAAGEDALRRSLERPLPECDGDREKRIPRSIWRFDPSDGGTIDRLRDDVDPSVTGLEAIDLDGDGRHELLLVGTQTRSIDGTRIVAVPVERAPFPTGLDGEAPRNELPLVSTEVGRMTVFAPADGTLRPRATIDLPVEADRVAGSWRVGSVRPQLVERRADGTLVFGSSPEAHDTVRVQTTLWTVAPDGNVTTTDSWSRLPEGETLFQRTLMRIDGRPHLLAATTRANRVNLFGEQELALYTLERDRSRLGRRPVFATRSRMNLWQVGAPLVRDVDGDGLEDLVIGYWKGLRDSRVVLDVYRGRAVGTFHDSARTTAFDVKDGEQTFVRYGRDLTGDGRADLLVRGGGALRIHPGVDSANAKNLVDRRALEIPWDDETGEREFRVQVNSPEALPEVQDWSMRRARPRIVDLDGDGRPELLAVSRGMRDEPGRVRVIRFAAGN